MKTKKNKIKHNFTKKSKKYFYINSPKKNIVDFINNILTKYNYVESNKFPVDFVYVDPPFTNYKYKVNSFGTEWINNMYGNTLSMISNKYYFYKHYINDKFMNKYLVPTIFIDKSVEVKLPRLPRSFVKIIKPAGLHTFSGHGIQMTLSKKDVKKAINDYPEYNLWVLQDYLQNPDLFNKHKFHIRVHCLLILHKNSKIQGYISNNNEILTSKKPYKNDDFYDKNIHDTHGYKRLGLPYFPKNLPDNWDDEDAKNKFNEIKDIFIYMFKNSSDFSPEWNATNAFCLLGADFMFVNKHPYLIEINKYPGVKPDFVIEDLIKLILHKPQITYERIF